MSRCGHRPGPGQDAQRRAGPHLRGGAWSLLEKHTSSGRLQFTTDYTEIADWADVHFFALGTPSGPGGAADLSRRNTWTRWPRC